MSTLEELTVIFRNVLHDPELILAPNMTQKSLRGWDSLTHMTIVSSTEKHFRITFTFNEVRAMKTIEDMVQIINSRTFA